MKHRNFGFRAAVFAVAVAANCASALAAGAIAVDDEAGLAPNEVGYGFVTGEADRESAGRAALQQCRDAAKGSNSCKVVARFDTCGAYVTSHSYYGVGWGSSKKAALDAAFSKCGANCSLVLAECE